MKKEPDIAYDKRNISVVISSFATQIFRITVNQVMMVTEKIRSA
jgi:hypothetical protein